MWRCLDCEEEFDEPGRYSEDPSPAELHGWGGCISWYVCPSCGSECIEEFDEDQEEPDV